MLRIHEIFKSISGECGIIPQGTFVTFIRLAGCNINCSFCDTKDTHLRSKSQDMPLSNIIEEVVKNGLKNIVITGGEPLVQQDDEEFEALIYFLHANNYTIQVETNGTIVPNKYPVDCWVIDYKPDNVQNAHLKLSPDQINDIYLNIPSVSVYLKFICESIFDYKKAIEIMKALWSTRIKFYFSVINGSEKGIVNTELIDMIIRDKLDIRFDVCINTQIHKMIGVK